MDISNEQANKGNQTGGNTNAAQTVGVKLTGPASYDAYGQHIERNGIAYFSPDEAAYLVTQGFSYIDSDMGASFPLASNPTPDGLSDGAGEPMYSTDLGEPPHYPFGEVASQPNTGAGIPTDDTDHSDYNAGAGGEGDNNALDVDTSKPASVDAAAEASEAATTPPTPPSNPPTTGGSPKRKSGNN